MLIYLWGDDMRSHKYVNDPAILLEQGRKIVSDSTDSKFVHRVSMVNLMLGGFSAKKLALYCGDSERTLQTWLKNVDEKGWETLIAKKQTGRPSKLTNAQIEEIKTTILAGPEASGYDVWDGPTLSEHIKAKYNVDYGVRSCQILMHRMGFALIRPQTYPSLENPDEEAREDFKKS